MTVFIIYVLTDYAHAVAIATLPEIAEQYAKDLQKETQNSTWVEEMFLGDQIIEL